MFLECSPASGGLAVGVAGTVADDALGFAAEMTWARIPDTSVAKPSSNR